MDLVQYLLDLLGLSNQLILFHLEDLVYLVVLEDLGNLSDLLLGLEDLVYLVDLLDLEGLVGQEYLVFLLCYYL